MGDGDRPRFVFFFDEAHLLFDDMPKELVDRIVQVVKLIRSKGVGVYFITQSPSDIPGEVLAQLSNRIQHGLRAYTPAEQKAVRAAAAAFRANPDLDAEAALGEVGTGEALVSLLDEEGRPSVVQRAKVLPPECSMGAAPPETMTAALEAAAPLAAKYGQAIDRESAYELIAGERAAAAEADALAAEREALERERAAFEAQRAAEDAQAQKAAERERERLAKEAERARVAAAKEAERAAREAERQRAQAAKAASSVLGQIGREAGRQLVRGLFGALRR